MLTENEVIDLFRSVEAVLDGHFLLSSGKHSDTYVQCAKLLQQPPLANQVCRTVVGKLDGLGKIDAVVGPALGGIVVAYELARILNVRGLFTERKTGAMQLRRGFRVDRGERILIAEDVVTTGGSSLESAEVIEKSGGNVVGIACLINRRSPEERQMRFPVVSAARMTITTHTPEKCPLCSQGIPLTKPGSRC